MRVRKSALLRQNPGKILHGIGHDHSISQKCETVAYLRLKSVQLNINSLKTRIDSEHRE